MSKIICEVCGTSYPETSVQCPICGCVSPGDLQSFSDAQDETAPAAGYTYVKGGRFSKSNVRKRNRGEKVASAPVKRKAETVKQKEKSESLPKGSQKQAKSKQGSNKGLIVTIVFLVLAIVAVSAYIIVKFVLPQVPANNVPDVESNGQSNVVEEKTVECTSILLDVYEVTMTEEGQTVALHVNFLPANTTDTPVFASSDDHVVKVDDSGAMTAVGRGEAVVTVTCGDISAECKVVCDIVDPLALNFRLNRQQITFDKYDASWVLYNGEIPVDQIVWSTDDANVATVEDGRVVAVGDGYTIVHAEFSGVVQSCEIICAFAEEDAGQEGNGGVDEEGSQTEPPANGEYHLDNLFSSYDTEVSIAVGEWFPLQLVDSNGNKVNAEWSVQDSDVCTVSDGDVKAVGAGDTYVIATYNGQQYRCLVHVS